MEIKTEKQTPRSSIPKDPRSGAKKTTTSTNTKAKSTHPPVAKMVNKAIVSLNEKGGSSVRAIKKYVAANFMVDPEKMTPFIKKYLTKAVENKILCQTKGTGLTGSFKMASQNEKKGESPNKSHVTASGHNKTMSKAKKSTKKVKKASSKSRSRERVAEPVEKKSSKTSTSSAKVAKVKA